MKRELSEAEMNARRKGGRAKKPRHIDYSACTPEWLREQYSDNNRSLRSIGEEIGWHKNKVKECLLKLGIELRNHKEQTTIQNKKPVLK